MRRHVGRLLIAFLLVAAATGLSFGVARADTLRKDCSTSTSDIDYTFFPFGFICQHNDGSFPGNPGTSVHLDGYTNGYAASLPGGNGSSDSNYTNVSPGQTLAFKTGFESWRQPRENSPGGPGSTTQRNVYVWTTIDANDSTFDDPFNPSNSIANGGVALNGSGPYTTATSSAISVNGQHDYCPGSGGTPIVIAYPDANDITGNTDRSPYWNSSHNGDGKVDCDTEGQMIYWKFDSLADNENIDIKFNIKLTSAYPSGTSGQFCVRTNVSVEYAGETLLKDKLGHIAVKSSKQCYWIHTSAVRGTVYSHPSKATGKPLRNVKISIVRNHSCSYVGPDWETLTTQSGSKEGQFEFQNAAGDPFCVRPEPGPTAIIGGTTYTNPIRLRTDYNGPNHDYGGTSPPDGSDVTDRNYIYDPVTVAPAVDKDSMGYGTIIAPDGHTVVCTGTTTPDPLSTCDPESLRPGDMVSFTISVKNSIDANQRVEIQDWIPLNIDPASVSAAAVYLNDDGNGPSGWHVDGAADPFAAIQRYSYANDDFGTSFTGDYSSGFSLGSGSTSPRFTFVFDKLPAYSEVTIEWSGQVKQANNIGVYPAFASPGVPDYRYCPGVTSSSYNNPNRVLTECEDKARGTQGVSNAVATFADGVFAPPWSNQTYNPIPSAFRGSGDKGIAGLLKDSNGNYILDKNDPAMLNQVYSLKFKRDASMGPIVDMSVNDQSAGPLNANITATGASTPGTIIGSPPAQRVQWLNQLMNGTGAVDESSYSFDFSLNPSTPIGTTILNTARACAPKYWVVGHTSADVYCQDTNAPAIVVANIINPYITGEKGDVRAGQDCSTGSSNEIRGGAKPGHGTYTVTATGSIVGFSAGVAKPTYGINCQPDIVGSAEKLATTVGKNTSFADFGAASQSSYAGKVAVANVAAGSQLDIPATSINGRWTLYVRGDVHITGNIGFDYGAPSVLNGTPSFGLIASGNIYIDPGVTQLNGFYFAGGRVNTCAANSTTTLLNGLSVAQCGQQLVVNGLLMGNSMRFSRTYVNATTGAGGVYTQNADKLFAAEYAKMIGQLYAATPPGFSSVTRTYNPPKYLQESPARY